MDMTAGEIGEAAADMRIDGEHHFVEITASSDGEVYIQIAHNWIFPDMQRVLMTVTKEQALELAAELTRLTALQQEPVHAQPAATDDAIRSETPALASPVETTLPGEPADQVVAEGFDPGRDPADVAEAQTIAPLAKLCGGAT
jgi:hypothetical protein